MKLKFRPILISTLTSRFPSFLLLFNRTIIQGLGYKSWEAQLLTVPPYILAFLYTMTLAYLSKIYARRAAFILSSAALSILGYIVLITSPTTGGQYVGVFLALSGIYSGNALLLAWPTENILGQTKRATGLAMVIGLGDIGAIIGTQVSRKESPIDREPGDAKAKRDF